MRADDGAPAPLHAAARGLLAEFRALEDMPADTRARVRRRLLDADDEAPPRRRAVAQGGTRSWIAWSLVGAAAGVALLLGLKAIAPMVSAEREVAPREAAPDRVEPSDASGRATVREEVPSRARVVAPANASAPTPADVPEVVAPPAESEPARPRAVHRAVSPREPEIAAPAPSASTLEAERKLIAQAWSALTQGDVAAALGSAASHRTRFPDGVLAPERLAVEAIAHCKRDGDAGKARAFLKAYARVPVAKRVRSACGLDGASAGSTSERTPTDR